MRYHADLQWVRMASRTFSRTVVIRIKLLPFTGLVYHWFSNSAGVRRKDSDDSGISPPVESSWQVARVLEVDNDPGLPVRCNNVGYGAIGAANRNNSLFALYQCIASVYIRSLSSFSGFFGRSHLKNVNDQQSKSDENGGILKHFFPKWGSIFAPLGVLIGGWGYWNIRDNRRLFWGTSTFLFGCILWMYGFARLITL